MVYWRRSETLLPQWPGYRLHLLRIGSLWDRTVEDLQRAWIFEAIRSPASS